MRLRLTRMAFISALASAALLWSQSPVPPPAANPAWTSLPSGTTASLRGLSVASPQIIWASGSRGTYLTSHDGGNHWIAAQVSGAARLDFRDVKAFSAQLAYLLAIAKDGGIYKTTDGGVHWVRQYMNPDPGFFLDSMAFWDKDHGVAVGDPINGHFLLLHTSDGGAHWAEAAAAPAALTGEGAFAASGTTIVTHGKKEAWFATGGPNGARVFHSNDSGDHWTAVMTPMASVPGTPGAGIFSLAFYDARHGVAVGGDYTKPRLAERTAATTSDGGLTWQLATGTSPAGYRSGVALIPGSRGKSMLAVGTSGSDLSRDGGQTWAPAGTDGFNSVAFPSSSMGIAVGERGRIARFTPPR